MPVTKPLIGTLALVVCLLGSGCNPPSADVRTSLPEEPVAPKKTKITLEAMTDSYVIVDGRRMEKAEFSRFASSESDKNDAGIKLHYYGDDPISDHEEGRLRDLLSKWRRIVHADNAFMTHPALSETD